MASIEHGAEASLHALGIAHAAERAPMVVALLDGLALHRHARPRPSDRQLLTDALYALHRGFVEADADADAAAERE
jgi:hypothetical protein